MWREGIAEIKKRREAMYGDQKMGILKIPSLGCSLSRS